MKTNQKLISILCVLFVVAGLFAGCNTTKTIESSSVSSEASQSKEGSMSGEASEPTALSGNLRFMWWGGDARHEATLAVIADYMTKNPGVAIEAEYGGFDGYRQKLSTQLAGGTQADLMQVDEPWLANFMRQGDFFLDLSQQGDALDLSGFDSEFLESFVTYDNRLIALPNGMNGISFLANKKVLDEAGVSFGEQITWEDLLVEGAKVNATNPDHYMINMDRGTNYFVGRIYLYQLTGKPLIADDYTIGVTKEEMKESFEFTKKLYNNKVVIPLEESLLFQGAPQDNPGWNEDKYGGWFNWASTSTLQNWGENAIALPYPKISGAEESGYIIRPSMVTAVAKNSENPVAAVNFLNYYLNDDAAIINSKDTRSIPANAHGRDLLSEKGLLNKVVIDSVDLAMAHPGTRETELSQHSEISGVMDAVFEKLIYNQYDAQAAVDEAFTLLEDVLANLKANNEAA